MAWIFRKRKKLLPGVHLNYGSSGLSLNVGVPGASVTLGKDGVYANTGLPGTGIRNRQKVATTEPQGSENIQIAGEIEVSISDNADPNNAKKLTSKVDAKY